MVLFFFLVISSVFLYFLNLEVSLCAGWSTLWRILLRLQRYEASFEGTVYLFFLYFIQIAFIPHIKRISQWYIEPQRNYEQRYGLVFINQTFVPESFAWIVLKTSTHFKDVHVRPVPAVKAPAWLGLKRPAHFSFTWTEMILPASELSYVIRRQLFRRHLGVR